jgi:probable HAF family extracellular repeat protein
LTDLGILEGALASFGRGINEDGSMIVGSCNVPSHAFLYSGGQMVDLNSLIPTNSGWVLTDAYSVNNSGQIVGYGTIAGATHAYVYGNGLVTDLGTFGGSTSYAYHINNNGQAVGGACTTNGIQHAFLYSNGLMTDLLPLGGLSYAYGINNHGDVVGRNDHGAFLYIGGVMTDLNTVIDTNSGWTLPMAAAISDNGHIVGLAGTSSYFGFLLTPRPVLQNFRFASGSPAFDLQGMTGFTYRVEYSGSLPAATWLVLTNLVLPSSPFSIVDTTAPTSGQRFYRAVLTQ